MSERYAIGIDLGGTNLKVALVDREGRVAANSSQACEPARGPNAVIAAMAESCRRLLQQHQLSPGQVIGIGLGSPGPLDFEQGLITKSANLPGWQNVPIRDQLQALAGLPVVLENDANAAAFGEYWAGAGRDLGDIVMLTLGTGVGGGVIIDGKLLHGHFGNAGELGHMIVVPEGLPCPCGQRGCLEQYASATAIARRAAAEVQGAKDTQLNARTLSAREVVEAARSGDGLAWRILADAGLYLGIACVNLQHAFNPAAIVFGGGLAEAGDLLLDFVRDMFRRQTWSLCEDRPVIVGASLGYDAGVIGAAGLVWTSQLGL